MLLFATKINNIPDIAKTKPGNSICTTVVKRDSAGSGVSQCRTREGNVGDISDTFVVPLRRKNVFFAAGNYFPRFFQIQQRSSEAVNITVA